MAKVLFGGGVAEMRGSEAGTTFSRNKGGSYTRQRVTPVNPSSVRQQSVRGNITELSTAWSNVLTQAQRDGWIAFADAFPITDVFGASIKLTGLAMYVRQNTTLLQAGLARIDTAPVNNDVESLLTASAVVTVTGSVMTVSFTPTPLQAGSRIQVFATPALSPGVSFVKNKLRLIFTGADASASPADVSAAWQSAFGAFPVAGQKVVFQARVLNSANGTVSTPLESAAIVGA